MTSVLIVGGGPLDMDQLKAELSRKPDFIVCADRGGGYLLELGLYPDILVGDFDSLPAQQLYLLSKAQENARTAIRQYPSAKDQTDMELAMDLALDRVPESIRILGGLGGRIDHTLGNIGLLLRALSSGVEAHLLDPKHDLTVTDKKIDLRKQGEDWSVSLVPLTRVVHGVTTVGLKYPLLSESLFLDKTRGIHNEFLDENVTIELKEGILLVVCFRE